jgi:hypothetical protein
VTAFLSIEEGFQAQRASQQPRRVLENSMNAVVMGPDTVPTSAKFATIFV